MTLLDAIRDLEEFDPDHTIYARAPWTKSSDAKVAEEGSEEEKRARKEGLGYFLEIFIASEVLEGWRPTQAGRTSPEQCCERIISYAENDA